MQDNSERIAWFTLVAVISALFFLKNNWYPYVASGTIVLLLIAVLLLKPHQPISKTPSPYSKTQGARQGPGGFFHKARHFVINNPVMTHIQVEDKIPRIMKLLAHHVIIGAAHDDSARGYPPRCHPGTRVKILEKLTTWFYNIERTKSLLWLSGPAGVGKSAIMQTFTESVPQPVASVFVSRPNKRNDPNQIFTTIAYQLAVRIDAYRNYVVGRLEVNPYLLNKSMQVQFQILIAEPFAEQKIGVGGPPIAILLDGLDEVEGVDAQRDIIRLISMFMQAHPDVPLVWIIASRPEPHISSTFNEITIQDRYELETIPIDSTDACEDVERFLRASFDTIRQESQYYSLGSWPEETAFAKLANAASGLFIFAKTAVRFIGDPDHANPIGRLRLVLSVIDHTQDISVAERPFALLDNLYTEIVSRIPSGSWPTTKLLMRLALFFHITNPLELPLWSKSRTLRGMIMILQLDHHIAYAALNGCFSMLGIPRWEIAHKRSLTFLHASFADYLMDAKRSGDFHITLDGVAEDILLFYLKVWHERFEANLTSRHDLINECDDETSGMTQKEIEEFNKCIFQDMAETLLAQLVERHKPQPVVSPYLQKKQLECLDSLRKINLATLCKCKYSGSVQPSKNLFSFAERVFKAWNESPHELSESGFLRQVSFKDANIHYRNQEARKNGEWIQLKDLRSRRALQRLVGRRTHDNLQEESLESFLSRSPRLPVLLCGTVPQGRVALLKGNDKGTKYCIVPYRG